MRVVVQRVKYATCTVDGKITGKCDKGFMLLIGFKEGDTEAQMDKMLKKVSGMRIFEDENGKMNRSLADVNGSILAISQFTLYADCKRGNRPSFTEAMHYETASVYYDKFCDELNKLGIHTEKGIFGADMKVELLNDGPVTILLDSDDL
ncbi:MAG: D-tyrosyl-tRNA(Tyr) deacylase [Acholeplasmatales bacterium]|nr:D-tyrosyl-tRNA(Tyr) deacylase [Acholeplasmatales bacterium]